MVKSKHKGDVIRLTEFHKKLAVKGSSLYDMNQTELIQTLLENEFPVLTKRMERDNGAN